MWRCTVCQHISFEESPPEVCPICDQPKDKFVPWDSEKAKREASGKPICDGLREPFCVGADLDLPVAEYSPPLPWQGLIEDIRLYAGALDRNSHRTAWQDWLDRPGCGCR